MKKLFLILCLFCGGLALHAQESTKEVRKSNHQIGLSAGYNSGIFKDDNFSPLHYSTSGLLLGLSYQKLKNRNGNIFFATLDYNADAVKTEVSDEFGASTIQANLGIAYLKNISVVQSDKWKFAVGGRYNFFLQYLDYNEQSAISFLANHSIDGMGLVEYQLNSKSQISAQLSLPLLSLTVRPPYNGTDEELAYNNDNAPLKVITNGDVGTVNQLFAYDLKLRYDYRLSNRFTWNVAYLNRYQNANGISKIVQMQHQFTTGLALNF